MRSIGGDGTCMDNSDVLSVDQSTVSKASRLKSRMTQKKKHIAHFIFTLPQKLLLAVVIDAEVSADTDKKSALERRNGRWKVVHLGPMDQLQLVACVRKFVQNQIAAGQAARSQLEVFRGANDDVLVVTSGELHQSNAVQFNNIQ